MMPPRTIPMDWQKPLQIGTFPQDGEELSAYGLDQAGVYLYFMRYPRMSVVYVGRANELAFRMREHLANYLGFRYPRRSNDPDPSIDHRNSAAYQYSRPDQNGLGQFNQLEQNIRQASDELRRMRIYYWPCPQHTADEIETDLPTLTKDMESILIECVKDLQVKTAAAQDHGRIISDNFRRERRRNVVEVDRKKFKEWLQEQIALEKPEL